MAPNPPEPPAPLARVLVLMSDAAARSRVAVSLASHVGIAVDVAEGDEAIAAAASVDYDLAVIDAAVAVGPVMPRVFAAITARAVRSRHAADAQIAAEAQHVARQKFASVFSASPAPMFMTDIASGVIVDVNPAFAELTGYPLDMLIGRSITDIDVWTDERSARLVTRLTGGQLMRNVDMRLRHRSGRTHDILLATERISYDGTHELCIGIATDVTEMRVLERKFQQAQKMEALGQLAGGVAHDFNNLLTVIGGFAQFIADREGLPPGVASDIDEILKATRTASSVTGQLLAFGRRSMIEPKIINFNSVVKHLEGMLRRLIGEHIILRTTLAADLKTVLVDQSQIDQIVMNLVVNARDAMPSGGQLTIETANVTLDADWSASHPGSRPGRFAMLSVTDTGVGMDDHVRRQLFEPFFTTKPRGQGTGLGLAMVYGAVKQNGGSIWAYSELGLGTTFKIYLPIVDAPPEVARTEETISRPLHGTETILVVEDHDDVRRFVRGVLERHGYTVIDASSPRETLGLLPSVGARVQLLITDVVMPQMTGRRLAQLCHDLFPRVRVLYMSGYAPDAIVSHGVLEPGLAFIQKPLDARTFLEKVRAVLDDPAPPPV